MTTITAITNTLLKKEPKQGSELESSEKVNVSQGETYDIVWEGKDGAGHKKVSLANDEGNWFIYTKHWEGLTEAEEKFIGITPKKLQTPYFSQRDNYRDSGRTCFSSSCAMLVETMKPGTLPGSRGDDKYVETVFSIGDTTEASVQLEALSRYGIDARFTQSASLDTLREQIDKGVCIPIGILHKGVAAAPRGGGHWICVYGYYGEGFWVMDPWGELDHASGYYSSTDGENLRYSNNLLNTRWTVSSDNDGWAIIA